VEREESLRAENIAALDDLKARLERAETASQQYQRQAEVLQSRLDETLAEHAKLEEKVHESEEGLETLRNERREAVRQIREMENIYEAERSAMNKEKDDMANREEEMQAVIQRLKDSLAQRNGTAGADDELRPSRHCEYPQRPALPWS
jgi:chromosome segregation ATPase